MTATITEIDTAVVDDLDYESPCQIGEMPGIPRGCSKAARWILWLIRHCGPGYNNLLLCDEHKELCLTSERPADCTGCGYEVARPFRGAIERIEPYNGGAS